jgi:hypothetical protein
MRHRRLLPRDQGVLWSDGAGTEVLFAYRSGVFRVSTAAAVQDLVVERRVLIRRERLHICAGHVYRISAPAG